MRYPYLHIEIDLPIGKNIDSIRTHVIICNSGVAEQKEKNAQAVLPAMNGIISRATVFVLLH